MKKGFSLIEVVVALSLIMVFILVFAGWLKRTAKGQKELESYYLDNKETILRKVSLDDGKAVTLTNNIKLIAVSANGMQLEYLKHSN